MAHAVVKKLMELGFEIGVDRMGPMMLKYALASVDSGLCQQVQQVVYDDTESEREWQIEWDWTFGKLTSWLTMSNP